MADQSDQSDQSQGLTMNKVFVYGTLKRGFYNNNLLIDKRKGYSVFIGEAILESRHALVTMPSDGLPCLIPLSDDSKLLTDVYGELFEVDDAMLAVLDELEECPTWYTRTVTTCKLLSSTDTAKCQKDSSVTCYVYIKTNPDPELYSLPFISNFVEDETFTPKAKWRIPPA